MPFLPVPQAIANVHQKRGTLVGSQHDPGGLSDARSGFVVERRQRVTPRNERRPLFPSGQGH